jgi:membrane protease subunit HflC
MEEHVTAARTVATRRRRQLVGVVLLLLFALYSASFRVSYYEAAVVTTFGSADERSVVRGTDAAGLHWRWPLIQQVRLFDTRVQVVADRLEEQQTRDKQNVIVNAFLAWRCADPLQFFRTLRTVEQAEQLLIARLRDARSQLSDFSFDELTNSDPQRLRLEQAEQRMLTAIRGDLHGKGYGIEVLSVGIKQITLSQLVTEKVFERMRQTRKRLAQRARSEGEAAASDIRARATSDAERILAFAERRATAIRAKGDEAAAEYVAVFNDEPDFAIFLRELAALRQTLKNNTTFLIDTATMPFSLFVRQPPGTPATPKDPQHEPQDRQGHEPGSERR